jgi:hypothetical protein
MYAENNDFLDRPAPCFDAHLNLLKSRRAIPRSSGKPDLLEFQLNKKAAWLPLYKGQSGRFLKSFPLSYFLSFNYLQ